MTKKIRLRPIHSYFLLTGILFLVSLAYLFFTRGASLDQLIFQRGTDHFMDFFNHIDYVKHHRNVYFESPHACFPPLIYFMYYVFGHMMPDGMIVRFQAGMTGGYAYLLYAAYTAVLAVLFAFAVGRFFKDGRISLAVTGTVLFSDLFLFHVLERGNSVMIVVVLLMLAVSLKDSDSAWKRELALILIAVAAAVKLYPAVFGLLYLREKRWKEAIRLTVYGILLFMLPFLFFGGFEGFTAFLANQQTIQSTAGSGFGSIHSVILWIGEKTGTDLSILSSVLPIAVGGLLIFLTVISKERWVRLFFLTCIMTLVPFWSGSYTRILFAVPLAVFLSDEERSAEKKSAFGTAAALAFGLIFSLFTMAPLRFTSVFQDTPATVVREAGIFVFMVFLMVRGSVKWIRSFKK